VGCFQWAFLFRGVFTMPENLEKSYREWLEKACYSNPVFFSKKSYLVFTEYIDISNDNVCIYIEENDDGLIVLHDDGDTFNYGPIKDIFTKEERADIFNAVTKKSPVLIGKDDVIFIKTTRENYPVARTQIVQAILEINGVLKYNSPFRDW
jgi:hypothetical protein